MNAPVSRHTGCSLTSTHVRCETSNIATMQATWCFVRRMMSVYHGVVGLLYLLLVVMKTCSFWVAAGEG